MSFQVDVAERPAEVKRATCGWLDRSLDAFGRVVTGPRGERASRWLAYITIGALVLIVAAAWWRGSR